MTNIINTRVISLTPTITRHTTSYVGVFQGCPTPPVPLVTASFKNARKYFVPATLFNIRARSGIFFSLDVRPRLLFRII